MKDTSVNSEQEARDFWYDGFGEPIAYTSYEQLIVVEKTLVAFKDERQELVSEIQHRDVSKMAPYKINRAIELYFLIKTGDEYFNECGNKLEQYQEELEPEYEKAYNEFDSAVDPWREDGLFPSNYDN